MLKNFTIQIFRECRCSKNSILNRFNGFTLAEVLITLVIIGVIAAMTIPTAINNMQEQELKSQFAKAYSSVSQALYRAEMYDMFGSAQCYYPYDLENDTRDTGVATECSKLYTALAKQLKVTKTCKNNAKAEGCVPQYQSYNSSGCGGYSEDNINNYNTAYVLPNGQIIIRYFSMPLFLIDINGQKGPNAYGKDLFSFGITKHNNSGLYINSGVCDYPVSGGRTTREMIKYSMAGIK